jgi:hypothetical protein
MGNPLGVRGVEEAFGLPEQEFLVHGRIILENQGIPQDRRQIIATAQGRSGRRNET